MQLFLSTFTNKIDKKGRVSVPAPFRSVLAKRGSEGFVAVPSFKFASVQCMDNDWLGELYKRVEAQDAFSTEQDDMTTILFAAARPLTFDSEGRIVLTEDLVAHAKLDGEAAFVGRGKSFEIWEPAAFREYHAAAVKRAAEKGMVLPPPRGA